jgi:uncharacterized protein YutE (UPF0331/DUF86 family)
MSPLDEAIVRRKLAVIVENLKALEPIEKLPREEYLRDLYKRKATERMLQELIEAAIDINTHIIVQTGNAAPADYYESFLKIGELGIVPADLSEMLAPSAGLRNRLVHEYDGLDHAMILAAVAKAEELYPLYIKAIETYLPGSR